MILSIKNIVNTARNASMIFALLIICEVVSVLVILFSQGVYQNYQIKTESEEFDDLRVQSATIGFGNIIDTWVEEYGQKNFATDGYTTVGEFKSVMEQLDDRAKETVTFSFIATKDQNSFDEYAVARPQWKNEISGWGLLDEFVKNTADYVEYGRMISDEEEAAGEFVCVVPHDFGRSALNSTIEFLGNEYKVIGIYAEEDMRGPGLSEITVPFLTLPDDLITTQVEIVPLKTITSPVWRDVRAALYNVYGENVHPAEIPVADETEITFYKSVMLIAIALSVLCAVNLAILFRYILSTRKRALAIFCISGCTKARASAMYLSEIIGISTAIFALCALLYHLFILPRLTFAFEHIQEVYTLKAYLYIFAVFIITLAVTAGVMIIRFVSRSPILMLKKGGT